MVTKSSSVWTSSSFLYSLRQRLKLPLLKGRTFSLIWLNVFRMHDPSGSIYFSWKSRIANFFARALLKEDWEPVCTCFESSMIRSGQCVVNSYAERLISSLVM